MNWTAEFTETLVNEGFEVGKASPCNFYHPIKKISTTVHGDDFTSTGTEKSMLWLKSILHGKYDCKSHILGPNDNQLKELRIFNRVIVWNHDGIYYEADQRHADLIIKELGLEDAKPVNTPGTKEIKIECNKARNKSDNCKTANNNKNDDNDNHRSDTKDEDMGRLPPNIMTQYRALAARLNFLALDRPDLQFTAKEVSKSMSNPISEDFVKLRRVARYLIGNGRMVQVFMAR